jgi:D-3-phosphoglycerate dehydrogenase / 2-oxoglutarate reductase
LSIAGTVHWGHDARIVMIDDLRIELQAKGNILYIENRDVPGMVGRIGTVLGKHRINIADMTLGRDRLKRRARTLISVDGKITPGLLQKIRRLKNIIDAKPIQL